MDRFVYLYSDIYTTQHEYVSKCLTLANIEHQSIKIDDISKPQEKNHTFNNGVTIKIDKIIETVQHNMGHDIVFSDVTIGFNPGKIAYIQDYFNSYREYDLCWQNNRPDKPNWYYNIGVQKIKCNDKMLDFYKQIQQRLVETSHWDQDICNQVFKTQKNNINFRVFDDRLVANGEHVFQTDKEARDRLYIWKQLCVHNGKTPQQIVELRLDQLERFNFLI